MHVCGQAKILKKQFIRLGTEMEYSWKTVDNLRRRHLEILDLAEFLVDTISFVLVIQLLLSSLLICTLGFQIIILSKIGDYPELWKTILSLGAIMAQLLAYSYVGDYLKCQMEDIGYSLYQSIWYTVPRDLMKNLILIMMRARHPVHLIAGRCIVMNMETYMSIVKTSVSYLSMLRVIIDV